MLYKKGHVIYVVVKSLQPVYGDDSQFYVTVTKKYNQL